jgi:hypothetical protein
MVMSLLALILTLVSTSQAGCRTISDTAGIQLVGRFSDVRYTEEHSYGHVVELWRAGDCVFGLFEKAEGLTGDTPTGLLLDVRYTPDGRLAFTAKLTTGITTAAGSTTWVPSRDLFVFTGRLERTALEGTLRRSDKLRPAVEPADIHIVLRRIPEQDGLLEEAKTYGAWRKAVEPILRFRGPKW